MTDTSGAAGERTSMTPITLRVTVRYRGTALELGQVVRVAMRAPPPVTPAPREGQAGFWIEVRARDGTLLFHRVLHDPIRVDRESFDERGQTITRHPLADPSGEFELLVPDVRGAATLVLQGSVGPPGSAPTPARPLLSAAFEQLHAIADKQGDRR